MRTPHGGAWLRIAAGLAVLSAPVEATLITQTVQVSFSATQPFQVSDLDTHTTFGATTADLNDIEAHLQQATYSGTAVAGVFGDVGLSAAVTGRQAFGIQALSAFVLIQADDLFQNTSGSQLQLHSDFVIDGGSLQIVPDVDSFARYDLSLFSRVNGGSAVQRFTSTGLLDVDPVTHETRFTSTGADLGTLFPSGRHREAVIPVSLQSADLGILNPGESLSLTYSLEIRVQMGPLGEVGSGSFSDPLSLSGNPLLGTLTATPVGDAVPEPRSVFLAGLGLLAAAALLPRRQSR
ncbi:MAG TPA: hypothetical protein VGF59_36340 [Bryobacteraceae bacterium]|jgi:hypothetical protein